jgi:APA family basic amino acid/polyamine antiporter
MIDEPSGWCEIRVVHRDLPVAILASLGICSLLYMAVCLIITGMQPYYKIDPSAPLTSAFQK